MHDKPSHIRAGAAPECVQPVARLAPWALLLALLVFAILAAAPARAAVAVSVNGNTATATISLAGGVEADLTLAFSQPENLTAESLGIDAQLVSPLDLSLLSRLPDLSADALTSAFPVLITIEPPASSGLGFSDTVRVEVHTHNLQYVPGTRLRLFKAPLDGIFRDITDGVEPGSVRTRGRTGGFSQFLVLLDVRSSSAVAREKYDALEAGLAAATGLSVAERDAMEATLAESRLAFDAGDPTAAISLLDQFDGQVRQLSGSAIPNRWRAARDLENVAGELQAGAATLRYTLGFLRDYGD